MDELSWVNKLSQAEGADRGAPAGRAAAGVRHACPGQVRARRGGRGPGPALDLPTGAASGLCGERLRSLTAAILLCMHSGHYGISSRRTIMRAFAQVCVHNTVAGCWWRVHGLSSGQATT